jgi:hypothetical protein
MIFFECFRSQRLLLNPVTTFVFSITVLFSSMQALQAQEPLEHEKRVYRSDDNKLYINKDLPLYLRVATSADDNAESWLLTSEKTDQYSNPMFLDTEGWNTLRSPSAIDKTSKKVVYPLQDVIFDLYADGEAPSSSLLFGQSEMHKSDDVTFLGDNIDIKFEATDGMSGVEDVYYSVNGEAFKADCKHPLSISEEGAYQLTFYAVDYVGNVEDAESFTFVIDQTPPVTTQSVVGVNKDNVLAPDATINLSGKDTLSGVADIYFAIDDSEFEIYTKPIPVSRLKEGGASISYYAEDEVGNKEELKVIGTMASSPKHADLENQQFDYYIDREAPVVAFSFEGDYYESDRSYISERTKVVLEAEDDKSGVQNIFFSYNSFITKETYEDPFNPVGDGTVELSYSGVDRVGNTAVNEEKDFYIDRKAPESEIDFDGPVFRNRDTLFISGETQLKLNAADSESGVKSVTYVLNGKEEAYNETFVVDKRGHNTIEWKSVDNVNNIEFLQSLLFIVDNEPPSIHYHYSVEPIGQKEVRDEKYIIYPSNTMLYIGATDDVAGEERLQYSINGEKMKSTIPVVGFAPGNYEISIEAIDALKNKSTETIHFSVEE